MAESELVVDSGAVVHVSRSTRHRGLSLGPQRNPYGQPPSVYDTFSVAGGRFYDFLTAGPALARLRYVLDRVVAQRPAGTDRVLGRANR